jgi:hypothetical protein
MDHQLPVKFPLVTLAAAAPAPWTVNVNVDVADAGAAGGVYVTSTVQELPGASTVVLVQVPPVVSANVPVPVVRARSALTGAAENENDAAVAPPAVLVTVTVPFFCVRVAPEVVSPVAAKPRVAPWTVNGTGAVVPAGFVTVTLRLPTVAAVGIVNVVEMVVGLV